MPRAATSPYQLARDRPMCGTFSPLPPLCLTLSLLALMGLALTAPVAAAPSSMATATLHPVTHVYGLPRRTRGPEAAEGGRIHLGLDWASHAVFSRSGQARTRFDGETRRYTLAVTGTLSGLRGGWWALEAPYLTHDGGVLDGTIDAWHKTLGLPHGDRANRPEDQLLFRVVDQSGQELLHRDHAVAGPGDVAVAAGLPIKGGSDARRPISVGIRLELPTGDPDRVLGSGSWDVASWLGSRGRLGNASWSWHTAAGALYMTDSEVLSELHRNWAGFARLALAWEPLGQLTLRGQLDGHTPFYRSRLRPLGDPGVELRAGAAWDLPHGYRLEGGFSEDIAVTTAPDITFHLRLSRGHR